MKKYPNAIAIPATYEDLLFLNKNKEYGAYVLRKLYKRHIIIACLITIIVFSLSVSSPLFLKKDVVKLNTKPVNRGKEYTLPPPPSIGKEKEMDKIQEPVISIKTIRFTPPRIVPNDENIYTYVPSTPELQNATPWIRTQAGQAGGVDPTLVDRGETVESNIVKPVKTEAPFTWAEIMPSYSGGQEGLLSFFSSKIQYPELAVRAGIQGKVFISFIVEKDGSISDLTLVRGIGGGCDEEALRVASMLEKFHPARQNGSPVRVKMTIPIYFILK